MGREMLFQKPRLFNCSNRIDLLKCKQCTNFETDKLVDLHQHYQRSHALTGSKEFFYKCGSCAFKTYSKFFHSRHALFNVCMKNVKVKWEVGIPEEIKEELEETKFYCQHYSYKAKTLDSLKKHVNNKHGEKKRVKCETCLFETTDKHQLKSHKLFKHTDPEKIDWFHCELCSYKAKTKKQMRQHVNIKHNEEKRFKCENCPFETKTNQQLRRHILNLHTDLNKIRWFHCEHCSYKAKTKGNLQLHVDHKHIREKQFKCANCPFETKFKSALKSHILVKHTDSQKIELFHCRCCSYVAKAKSQLRRHINYKHDEEKRLKCENCPFKTKYKEVLKNHIVVKHADFPKIEWFYCPWCLHKVKTDIQLKRHLSYKHNDKKDSDVKSPDLDAV